MSKLNLALFTTTKGHFGRTDIYKRTVRSLKSKVDFNCFSGRFVHIKKSKKDNVGEMMDWLNSEGFHCLVSEGDWSHANLSHQHEYLKDIFTVFHNSDVNLCPYTLWLEDDFVFVDGLMSVQSALGYGVDFLKRNPETLAFRFVREGDADIKQRTQAQQINPRLFGQRREFSFNPVIVRTRDAMLTMKIVNKNLRYLSQHCEMAYTQVSQYFSDAEHSFVCLEPNNVFVKHIGVPAGQEDNLEEELLA